jgi:hypothetical protein
VFALLWLRSLSVFSSLDRILPRGCHAGWQVVRARRAAETELGSR